MKIQLKRSNVTETGVAKKPTAAQMEYGELAVNYNKDDPSLFIKGNDNSIIRLAGRDSASIPDGTGNIGAIGYWNRSGTELTTINPGDDVTLTGDLTADKGIYTGLVTASAVTLTGNITATKGIFSGNLSAQNVALTGTCTAKKGIFSGLVTAPDVTLTGDLLADDVTLTGDLTADKGILTSADIGDLTFSGNTITSVANVNISAAAAGQINFKTKDSNGNYSFSTTDESSVGNLRFNDITQNRNYSFPDKTGTIALRSDVNDIDFWSRSSGGLTPSTAGDDVTLTGDLTAAKGIFSGLVTAPDVTLTGDLTADKGILTSADIGDLTFSGNTITAVANVNISASGSGGVYFRTKNANGNYSFLTTDESNTAILRFNDITSTRYYAFPDKGGTIALTDDVFWRRSSGELTPATETDDVIIGSLTFSGNNITSEANMNIRAAGSGQISFKTKHSNGNYGFSTTDESSVGNLRFNDITQNRNYAFPDKTGTIALTSDVNNIDFWSRSSGVLTPATAGDDVTLTGNFQSKKLVVNTETNTEGHVAASFYGSPGSNSRGLEIKLGTIATIDNSLVTLDAKQTSQGALAFATRGTERMRLSGATLLFGGINTNTSNIVLAGDTGEAIFSGPVSIGGKAAANTIEEYEEGSYTPYLTSNGGVDPTQSYASQDASYVRIGKLCSVKVTIKFASSGITSGTEAVQVSLPFNVSGFPTGSISIAKGWTSNTPVAVQGKSNSNSVNLKQDLNNGNASCADVKNNTQINFSLVYEVA